MGGQIAKLFVRGSLFNVTGKGLNPAQIQEVGQVCQLAYVDSKLQRGITEFCAALGRTIGNEYKDVNVAREEVLISFWAAAVDVLHHRPKKNLKNLIGRTCDGCNTICDNAKDTCPECGGETKHKSPMEIIHSTTDDSEKLYAEITGNPIPKRDRSIIDNPIQRKKFFQTYLFNYLRQILRENHFPKTEALVPETAYADVIAHRTITSIIKSNTHRIPVETEKDGFDIRLNLSTLLLTLDNITDIAELKESMAKHGVCVKIDKDSIQICRIPGTSVQVISSSVTKQTKIHHVSLDSFREDSEQDSFRDHLESQSDRGEKAMTYKDVDLCDSAAVVRSRLCPTGQAIFDLIRDVPESYENRFGTTKIHKSYVAKFLGLSQKEINRQWGIIQLQMRAVGLTPKS